MHRAGTTSLPGRPSAALALAGPYRWTRNPMCLGMAGVYLSLGFLLNAVAPLLLFLPVFAVMDRRVIRWEERTLAAKFGTPYLAYLSRVPRWSNLGIVHSREAELMRHKLDAPPRASSAAALFGPQSDGIEPGGPELAA